MNTDGEHTLSAHASAGGSAGLVPAQLPQLTSGALAGVERLAKDMNALLEMYRKMIAPLQHNSALDVLKTAGGQIAMTSALNGTLGTPALVEIARTLKTLSQPSVLEYARGLQEILNSAQFVERFSMFNATMPMAQDLARLGDISRLVSSQLSVLNGSIGSAVLARAGVSAVLGWESAATAFVEQPSAERVLPLKAFGRGTVGITSAVSALLPQPADIAASLDDGSLLGPASFGEMLRQSLASLDKRLPRRLDGAWERVSRPGPDAASQAAHSLMEVIDWTLRLAAPEGDVLAWHAAEGRPANELHNGRPPRGLQAEWLLRGRPGEAVAARLHLRALTDLVKVIQSHKHSANESDVTAVARLIPTVEGVLIFLLGISPVPGDGPLS